MVTLFWIGLVVALILLGLCLWLVVHIIKPTSDVKPANTPTYYNKSWML